MCGQQNEWVGTAADAKGGRAGRRGLLNALLIFTGATLAPPGESMTAWAAGPDLRQHLAVAALGLSDKDIQRLATTAPPGTIAVLGDDLGPKPDPRTVAHIQELRKRGNIAVYGYVPTGNGTVPPEVVMDNVDKWLQWYGVPDIFFDEGSPDPQDEAYYQAIRDYVRSHGGGTMLNGSDLMEYEGAMDLADIVLVAETSCQHFFGYVDDQGVYRRWFQPSWLGDFPPYRMSMTIYSCRDACDMLRAVALSKYRGSGYVYVYDGTPSAYDRLPSYWDQLIEAVESGAVTFPRPPLAELMDPFDEGLVDPSLWSVSAANGATVTAEDNELTIGLAAATPEQRSVAFVTGWDPFDRTDSQVSVEVREVVGAQANNRFAVQQYFPFREVRWQYEGGQLFALYQGADGKEHSVGDPIPYKRGTPLWLRLRFEAGMVFWDQSGDGIKWTEQRSARDPLTERTSVVVQFSTSTFGDAPLPGRVRYANLNLLP